jgi:uncharacterized protein YecE (DUF72 family)
LPAYPIHVGCSGWNYRDWRGAFYPEKLPASRWLEHYATRFQTVEVNSTFYRLARPAAVARWLEQTPPDFLFTVKASRYLTHYKRLADIAQGIERFYAGIAPLAASPRLGPVLWQLPPDFKRDDERLAAALDALPPGRHAVEFRHPTWFTGDVFALLFERDVALAVGDDPRRPFVPLEVTASFAFVRFHHGHRGRRGNYSEAELRAWAARLAPLAGRAELFAYFNNDWEAFAPRNAVRFRALLSAAVASGP